jgi:hypothetical protein
VTIDVELASATALRNVVVSLAALAPDDIEQAAYTDLLTAVYLLAYMRGESPNEFVARLLMSGLPAGSKWDGFQARIATITSEVRERLLPDGGSPPPEAEA